MGGDCFYNISLSNECWGAENVFQNRILKKNIIKTTGYLIALKSIKFWVESLGQKYTSKRKSLLRWTIPLPKSWRVRREMKWAHESLLLKAGFAAAMSFLLTCLLLTNTKIIIIIIIRALLLLNMSKYFLIIFLGTWRSDGCTSADTAVLWARSPSLWHSLPGSLSNFPEQGKQEAPATLGVSGLQECSILEVEAIRW